MTERSNLVESTAQIVAAYVSKGSVAARDLPALIRQIHRTVLDMTSEGSGDTVAPPLSPAVPISDSVTPDYVICLEDGRKFMSMKRHLGSAFGLSPAQYRTKWGLPDDYPMVAPKYSAARSKLAKDIGLGRGPKKLAAPAPNAPA